MPRAARGVSLLALVLGILLLPAPRAEPYDEVEESYLRGRGPYRGRVIDAKTRQPIAGAVVLAVWYYNTSTWEQPASRFYDAMEVLTDAQGSFVVNAPEVERRAPRRTFFPLLTIYKLGYKPFRGGFADPEVLAERYLRPLLVVAELIPDLGQGGFAHSYPPDPPFDVPPEKVPEFMKAVEEALEARRRPPPSIPFSAPLDPNAIRRK